MHRRPYVRALLASAAIAAAIALAGCDTDGTAVSGRALKPLSDKMLAALEEKNMTKDSPILVRVFKEESELEVWKQDRSGKFALLKTYPICRWSGELGPKIKEGDRQTPEGFYTITPGQMNPNSHYYLAFNVGYPNAFDRAWGRTGGEVMVHGDCSSAGCFAMTDEQVGEIYALARESLFGGQRSFQVQSFPFRMTPLNMARHRDNPNMPFWNEIKVGYDLFEVTHEEPKVDVCDKHYVFDAEPANGSAPLNFSPKGACPAYRMPDEIAAGMQDKQRQDEFQTAELIRKGTPTVPVRMGTDGGMNPVFLAALKGQGTAPGTIPSYVNPPHLPGQDAIAVAEPPRAQDPEFRTGTISTAAATPAPSATPAASAGSSITARLGSLFGGTAVAKPAPVPTQVASAGDDGPVVSGKPATRAASVVPPRKEADAAKPKPEAKPAAVAAISAKPKTDESAKATVAAQPLEQQASAAPAPAGSTGFSTSAQPSLPVGSFNSRWGGLQ